MCVRVQVLQIRMKWCADLLMPVLSLTHDGFAIVDWSDRLFCCKLFTE